MRKRISIGLAGIVAAVIAAFTPTQPVQANNTIIDVADSAGSFTTLLSAIETAGLTDTLRGDGPFTVFAPTDEAFAKVDSDTLTTILGDQDLLSSVLLYHVAGGNYDAENVLARTSLDMLSGDTAPIDATAVTIDGAMISQTDIGASNGIIHVLDSVILPDDVVETLSTPERVMNVDVKEKRTKARRIRISYDAVDNADRYVIRVRNKNGKVVKRVRTQKTAKTIKGLKPGVQYTIQVRAINDTYKGQFSKAVKETTTYGKNTLVRRLASDGRFDTLVSLLGDAKLKKTLNTTGQYTFFAPTDDAFAALPEETLNAVLADSELLNDVLLYHVHQGRKGAARVVAQDALGMLSGSAAGISADNGVYINNAQIIETNMRTNNGVIHVIDTVLVP